MCTVLLPPGVNPIAGNEKYHNVELHYFDIIIIIIIIITTTTRLDMSLIMKTLGLGTQPPIQ
jgi:hypothetical protein